MNPKICARVLGLVLLSPVLLQASGSYNARPPRPPTITESRKASDKDKYELGKKIYSGKARLSTQSSVSATQQETRLRALQNRLPESEKKNTNLPALAGKLTAEQLDALEYYVDKRFPLK